MSLVNKPINYSIYKGMGGKHGALQFTPIAAYAFCSECKNRFYKDQEVTPNKNCRHENIDFKKGGLLVSAASARGKNDYDWTQKIMMALSVDDLGKVLQGIITGQTVELFHDPGAQTASRGKVHKKIIFIPNQGKAIDGVIVNIMQKQDEVITKHSIPLSGSEVIVLRNLMESIIPSLLNW